MDTDDLPVEYDMSFSTNTRINYLLWQCNENMNKEDVLSWFKNCKNILKELSINIKDSEMVIHRGYIKKIEGALNNYQNYEANYNAKVARRFMPPRDVFDLLYEWEIILRKRLDEGGYLIKRQQDLSRVME